MPNVSSILPIIPYGGFSLRLEGWHIRRDLPEASISLSLLPRDPTPRAGRAWPSSLWSAWRAPFGLARALKVATMERMKLSIIGGASAVALIALISAGTALADPKGVWLAQDGARVRVGPCGGALCATIATSEVSG